MDIIILSLVSAFVLAGCSAIGGSIAFAKRRHPWEGLLLGLVLGPLGIFIEARLPAPHRPEIDPDAWKSLRSVVDYQSRTNVK